MRTQAEIEQSIREALPVIFGEAESVDPGRYLEKRKELVEYAAAVSEPYLREETIRYQSILLYVSLLFVSVSLFQIGKIKIGEDLISVDKRLLLLYTIFIACISLVFLIKSYVDYKRAQFTRERNDHMVVELQELMSVGRLRTQIQEYFWLEIFDMIGSAYKYYDDAVANAMDSSPTFQHTSMKEIMTLDIDKLRKIPALADEIEAHETYLNSLRAKLAEDETRFRDRAKLVLNESRAQSSIADVLIDDRYKKIRAAFEECLRPWFGARNKLTEERLSQVVDAMSGALELRRLNAIRAVLKRIIGLRRLYVVIEIFVPVLFALFAIVYVWFM